MMGRKIRNDCLLLAGLLIAVCLAGAMFYFLRGEGDMVLVAVNGEEYGTYPLTEDRIVEIRTGEDGAQINRLVIRDGCAYVELATCPDGICKNHRPISRDGESIVCLPHRVAITVFAEPNEEEADITA